MREQITGALIIMTDRINSAIKKNDYDSIYREIYRGNKELLIAAKKFENKNEKDNGT